MAVDVGLDAADLGEGGTGLGKKPLLYMLFFLQALYYGLIPPIPPHFCFRKSHEYADIKMQCDIWGCL